MADEEKKCRHCAMMIPKEARICPHCRKKQGISIIIACLIVVALFLFFGAMIETFSPGKPKPVYTAEQKKAAKEYQKILMDGGIIKELKREGELQVVYVNRAMWNIGTYENKKDILKWLSRTNETLGRTPWIEIRDHRSGHVYGALKPPLTMDIYE